MTELIIFIMHIPLQTQCIWGIIMTIFLFKTLHTCIVYKNMCIKIYKKKGLHGMLPLLSSKSASFSPLEVNMCGVSVLGLAGLPGMKGDRGRDGVNGLPGPKGDAGLPGRDGIKGNTLFSIFHSKEQKNINFFSSSHKSLLSIICGDHILLLFFFF